MRKAGFIGTGNMGGALIQAACRGIGAEQVIIANRTQARAQALAAETGCAVAGSNEEAAREAEYLFLCVKPQLLRGVLAEITPCLREACRSGAPKVLVSIAAGVKTVDLRVDGLEVPVLRVMPNTPASIGQGMLALCGETSEEYFAGVEEILRCAGRIERIQETQMDAFSSVAGCGPAFVYQFIEALADGGVMAGLPRTQAQTYAAQMVLGSAAMVLESGKHPGLLKDEVCSPGGSTIAGVAALEKRAFRAAAIEAVQAACAKNAALGKQ